MKYLDALYKNEDIKRTLYGEICSDRLPHAYLIEGAEGSGKKTLAYAVAAELEYRRCADKSADIRESICGKIINGGCTDVILTDKPDDKKSIGIDTIRSFISEANLTPNELDFRFYIINNADVMTVQAQNALLKTIEEPPSETYIFLLCTDAKTIIPTVRSRVRHLTMQKFSEAEIKEYLSSDSNGKSALKDSETVDFISRICAGSPGKALSLLKDSDNEMKTYLLVKNMISAQQKANAGTKQSDFILGITSCAKDREEALKFLTYLSKAYGDIIRIRYNEDAPTDILSADEASGKMSYLTLDTLTRSLNAVNSIMNGISLNVNLNSALYYLAESLWDAVR